MQISESDALPKYICIDCWSKIADFHEFHQRVREAQTKYLIQLVKQEQDNNFVEIRDQSEFETDDFDSLEQVKREPHNENENTQITGKYSQIECGTLMEPINKQNDSETLIEIETKSIIMGIHDKTFDDFDLKRNYSDTIDDGNKKDDENTKRSKLFRGKYTCDICRAKISTKEKLKVSYSIRFFSFA